MDVSGFVDEFGTNLFNQIGQKDQFQVVQVEPEYYRFINPVIQDDTIMARTQLTYVQTC